MTMLVIRRQRVARTPISITLFICAVCLIRVQYSTAADWNGPAPSLNTTITFRIRAIFTMLWFLVPESAVSVMALLRTVRMDQTSLIQTILLAETRLKSHTICSITQMAM